MEEKWIIYTEIHENGHMERWYYGTYRDREYANETAIRMNDEHNNSDSDARVYRCVCSLEEAKALNIQNMPEKYLEA